MFELTKSMAITAITEAPNWYTLWLFNIAMENGPFIDDFPDFPNQMVDITSINQYNLPPMPGFFNWSGQPMIQGTAVGRRAMRSFGATWWGIIPPTSNARLQYSYIFTRYFKVMMWGCEFLGGFFGITFPAEVAFCSQSQALFSVLYWAIADQFFR